MSIINRSKYCTKINLGLIRMYIRRHRIELQLGNYRDIEIAYAPRLPWNTFDKHVMPSYGIIHYRLGRFVLTIQDPTVEISMICGECDSDEEISKVSCGTDACESWSVCPNCRSVEGRTMGLNKRDLERKGLV